MFGANRFFEFTGSSSLMKDRIDLKSLSKSRYEMFLTTILQFYRQNKLFSYIIFFPIVELLIFSSFDIRNQNINMVIYGKDTETNRRAKRPTYTYNVKCMWRLHKYVVRDMFLHIFNILFCTTVTDIIIMGIVAHVLGHDHFYTP